MGVLVHARLWAQIMGSTGLEITAASPIKMFTDSPKIITKTIEDRKKQTLLK